MTCPLGPTRDFLRRNRALQLLQLLVCLVVLVACGAEPNQVEEDRKFANDPVTQQDHTPTVGATGVATPMITEALVTASPETLLRSRGTPDTLYTYSNGRLVALSVEAGKARTGQIPLPRDRQVVDFDGSPSGDRVAVLMSTPDGRSVMVAFYKATGEQIGKEREVFAGAEDSATPQTNGDQPKYTISWSPQGTGVLITSSTSLVRVEAQGEPELIEFGQVEGMLRGAAWSPQGTRILLEFDREDGSQQTYLLDVEDRKSREVKALRTDPGMRLTELDWLPDGSGVAFVRGPVINGTALRGQIYVYLLSEEVPDLVGTSGQGGQSATVSDIAVSPDGRSIAYVISVLDGEEWAFHSMWVRALSERLSYQVPVQIRGVVTGLAWVDSGLIWQQRPSMNNGGGEIMFVGQNQRVVTLMEDHVATPAAPAGASPVVHLAASPAPGTDATPIATPIASSRP